VASKLRKPRGKYHHGDLRRVLVNAALAALDAGAVELNLRDMARRVGVSPGAPYRHFADKDALMRAVAEEISARFAEQIARAQSEAPRDALSQFRAVGIAHVRFAVTHPAHFRVMSQSRVADSLIEGGELGRVLADQRRGLEEAQRHGHLVNLPIDDILLAASSLTYGLARTLIDLHPGRHPGAPGVDADRAEALAVAVTNVLGCGLVPRSRPV